MIPLIKCKSCGRYNDISVRSCGCGSATNPTDDVELINPEVLSEDLKGEIHLEKRFYVKICRKCNAKYYFEENSEPIKKCTKGNCGSLRFSSPKEINNYLESLEEKPAKQKDQEEESVRQEVREEEPGELVEFGDLFGSEIILTEEREGIFSIRIASQDAKEQTVIGREAQCAEILSRDLSVSRRHCAIYNRNGNWYVEDLHSANGIAVNRKIQDEGAVNLLRDGDVITLGHRPDSVSFRVSIEQL